jgi:nicotinate phosphoribosyltransferase
LVTKSGLPKIKISQDVVKITIPGRKRCYRLYGKGGFAILDLMMLDDEPEPAINVEILCRHPFEESKRAKVIPAKIEQLQLQVKLDFTIKITMLLFSSGTVKISAKSSRV